MSFMVLLSSSFARYTSPSFIVLGVILGNGDLNFESEYLCLSDFGCCGGGISNDGLGVLFTSSSSQSDSLSGHAFLFFRAKMGQKEGNMVYLRLLLPYWLVLLVLVHLKLGGGL